jgi:hypothetical protein
MSASFLEAATHRTADARGSTILKAAEVQTITDALSTLAVTDEESIRCAAQAMDRETLRRCRGNLAKLKDVLDDICESATPELCRFPARLVVRTHQRRAGHSAARLATAAARAASRAGHRHALSSRHCARPGISSAERPLGARRTRRTGRARSRGPLEGIAAKVRWGCDAVIAYLPDGSPTGKGT